jgi:molybdate-binding protein
MKTLLHKSDDGWCVVDVNTEDGDLLVFRTKANAMQFRKFIKVLNGDTLQAKFDDYTSTMIKEMERQGMSHFEALVFIGHQFC